MKIAVMGDTILIKDATPDQRERLTGLRMVWDRREQLMRGPANYETLKGISEMVLLPPIASARLSELERVRAAIDAERSRPGPVAPAFPYPVRATLYDHQKRAANMTLLSYGWTSPDGGAPAGQGPGFGLLFEMGCGKTITAIAVIGAGYRLQKIRRVLIVAPTSVVAVWQKEFETFAEFPYAIRTMLGTKQQRIRALRELTRAGADCGVQVAVINYESTWRDEIFQDLQEYDADLILCDESQRIKTHNTAQSKALHRLGDKARYRMILSGTPVQNEAVDLWSQYRFLDPGVFGNNFYTFRARYCEMGGFNNKQIVRYKNMDELIKKEYSIAYRVTKRECLDLPEQTFENRAVVLPGPEMTLYNRIRRDSFAELENGETITAATVLTRLLRLQQLTGGFLQTDETARPQQTGHGKLDALEDILRDYVVEGRKKLVVFARFIPEIHAIEKLADSVLAPAGLHAVSICGEVPKEKRGAIVDRFQTDPATALFIGQIDTAGTGITLTAADTCVYYSLNFNYAAYSQSLSRIHRIGQENRCTYIHLIAEHTIDEKVLRALERKEDLAKTVVDNWKRFFTD